MPEFAYTAVDSLGQRLEGRATAADEQALARSLRAQDRYLVEAAPAGAASFAELRVFERVNRRDVIFFTQQLATMMATGVNIVDGLRDIEVQTVKAPMKAIVAALRRDIESGLSLSAALERHPSAFNDLYVNVVRAGEATGRADRALEDLVKQLEWNDNLASRVREVTTYPIIVLGLIAVLITVLVGFTIPRFADVYRRLSAQVSMPWPTLAVMAVADFFRTNWFVLLMAGVCIWIFTRLRLQTSAGMVWFDRLLLRIPIVGEMLRKIALSRFAHYFGTLHEAGLEVTPSLSLVERLIGNAFLARQFHRAVERVIAGDSLSRALATVGEFPAVIIQMVSLGERTGQMGKALENVRQYYDREVDRSVSRTLTLFGPLTLLILAGVFVTIALAFYLPLLRLVRVVR